MSAQIDVLGTGGLLTVPQAARLLSMSRSWLYQAMDRGKLAYVRLGKSRRIPRAAVEKLIAENMTGGFAAPKAT